LDTLEKSDDYQQLLNHSIFPGIEVKKIPSYINVELLRRRYKTEVEFIIIVVFEALQNVFDFQGEDYSKTYNPDEAKIVLKRWDEYASHYEVRESRIYHRSNT
jgi:hypothetical protein